MERMTSGVVAFLFLEFFLISTININNFCNGSSPMGCVESERTALLRFKQDLNDSSNRLSSWTDDGDCCKWAGVICNNFTGYVVELNLQNPFNYHDDDKYEAYRRSQLVGKINPSLLDLKHLNHLDLSGNDFQGIRIPKYLGFMHNLRYLNLSYSGLYGMVPHQLGNLSNLQYLDLSHNTLGLYAKNLHWLSGLSSLKHLDLSSVDLGNASDLLPMVNTLPSLQVLRLSACQLHHFPPLPVNLSFVHTLDLSSNMFDNSSIFNWVFGLKRLLFLDLNSNYFIGPIPDGLRNLLVLKYLDLSSNQFNSTIPDWVSEFNDLEYLSLRGNSLQGTISSGLGNLTSIQTLDLSDNNFEGKIPRSFKQLCNLKSIAISSSNLRQEISEVLNIFSECTVYSLVSLALSYNQFSGNLTNNLGKLKNLQSLDLRSNSLSGPIPQSLGELSTLKNFDLSKNSLSGSLPSSLGKLSSLTNIRLSDNKLQGYVPLSLGQLSSLQLIDLSFNKLNGTLSEIHFVNLTKLIEFGVSGNSLILKFNPNWVPPFQLQSLNLRSCLLGPQFPSWLHSQKNLHTLDISNTRVSDTIPNWFWKISSSILYVNLSNNDIHGEIQDLPEISQIFALDLSSNNLSGPLPPISFLGDILNLSNNSLWGSIFPFLCHESNMSETLLYLNLAKNSLSGDVSDCWIKWSSLVFLNLGHNNLSGSLPFSMGNLISLQYLNLRNNKLSGFIPMSFKNCTQLIALDIGANQFEGKIPTWIGDTFSNMVILNLRSNKFHGLLPPELCRLTSLHILDLAYNNLSGMIPRCFNNFSAMKVVNNSTSNAISIFRIDSNANELRIEIGVNAGYNFIPYLIHGEINADASLVMKGVYVDYNSILNLVRSIDISKNYFLGQIPVEMIELGALQSLNLSYNHFSGEIPKEISAMKSLESIDLSGNQLFGRIPQSMSSLTFLSHLNLSNNNLSGKIPLSTQLQSLEASSFTGNNLCGSPLTKNCSDQNVQMPFGEDENGDEDEVDYWLYVSMALGFVVGFWCFIGPLLVNQTLRYKYCHFLDRRKDKFCCFM